MAEAEVAGDLEGFRRLDDARLEVWKRILRQQHDLILFGGFSYGDVEKIPLVERDHFLGMTIERKKEQDEFSQGNIAAMMAAMAGRH